MTTRARSGNIRGQVEPTPAERARLVVQRALSKDPYFVSQHAMRATIMNARGKTVGYLEMNVLTGERRRTLKTRKRGTK